jgi:CSLREA domain-containing protein
VRTGGTRIGRGVICAVAATGALAVGASPSAATTFVVTTTADGTSCTPGDCTLRGAINAANANSQADKVVVESGETYVLSMGELPVTSQIDVRPSGNGRAKIDGDRLSAVFVVDDGDLSLDSIRVVRGLSTSFAGGGVLVFGGSLFATRSAFVHNRSAASGGGIAAFSDSSLELRKTRVTANDSDAIGGGIATFGTANIRRSTISGNSSFGAGGGISASGEDGNLTLVNSTVANNQSDQDGGGIFNEATAHLKSVTVARNEGNGANQPFIRGGGISTRVEGPPFLHITNSIVALNTIGNGQDPDCYGDFASGGYNLVGDVTAGCTGFDGPGDTEDPTPGLLQLADNGGPTQTIGLQADSPAIAAANPVNFPATDQRGVARDGPPDIGAFEFTGAG